MYSEGFVEFRDAVAREKYFLEGEESWDDVIKRVSNEIGNFLENKLKHENKGNLYREMYGDKSPSEIFYNMMSQNIFIPGGRILYGAGNPNKVTLTNCYVLPSPDDSIEGIMKLATEMALTYRAGGGVGFDISSLRPEGSPVRNAARTSTGAWSFMELYSLITGIIGQAGRRGALLIAMDISHPDVLKFVSAKSIISPNNKKFLQQASYFGWTPEQLEAAEKILTMSQIRFANLSVKLTDEFMKAVKAGEEWAFRWKGKVMKTMPARDVFKYIAEFAWKTAEPGILFVDTAKRYSTTEYFSPIVNTNPCGEQWLGAYGNCNLGAINVGSPVFFRDGFFDYVNFGYYIKVAILFMNAVIWYNLDRHPLPEQKKTAERERRIGLGIMGLADAYIRKGVEYGEGSFTSKLAEVLAYYAYSASIQLSKIFGSFPDYDPDKHFEQEYYKRLIEEYPEFENLFKEAKEVGLANSALLTIAPTGTTSIMAGASSGIEPVFGWKVQRWFETAGKMFEFYHPVYYEYINNNSDEKLPEYFQTYADVDYRTRLDTQAILQKFIDNSISSTVNLPESVSVEDIENLYMEAWEKGLKGITVYRENSRFAVIKKKDEKSEEKQEKKEKREELKIFIPAPKKAGLEGKRYRFKYKDTGIYIMVFGENNVPREVFLGSKNLKCWDFAIALNTTLSEILRSLPEDLAITFAKRMVKKYKSLSTGDSAFIFGEKLGSVVGLWGLALDWYMNGIDPNELEEEIKRSLLTVNIPNKPKPSLKTYNSSFVVLYEGLDLKNGAELPNDAVISRCPSCGAKHITKGRPYSFDCEHPCMVCGYSEKCPGD